MCFSEKGSSCLGYIIVLFKVRAVFLFSVEALFWMLSRSFESVVIAWKALVFNAHVFPWKENLLFGMCQIIVRIESSVPFLCRSFILKDNHVLLKAYEFHARFIDTHKCFYEKKSSCLCYVKVLLEVSEVL